MPSAILTTIRRAIAVFLMVGSVSASAADKVGVLLMHGKKGAAEHMQALAADLRNHGYLAVTPNMPWSGSRAYDRPLDEAHREIDALVELLRLEGATRIVVAGHSMGANMALGYAATHEGLDAVMALGPGQTVESPAFAAALGGSVGQAKQRVADGHADAASDFADLHLGKVKTANTTARIYLSYFDPAGLANMPQTAPRIAVPLLWTVGDRDKNMLDRGPAYAFDRAKPSPLNRYAVVHADHMGTPDASRDVVLGWLDAVFPDRRTD